MKKRGFLFTLICVILSCVMCLGVFGCQSGGPGKGDEYTLELEEGYRQLTIYYNRAAGYENCDIWLWYGDTAGKGYLFHECEYGAKVVVNVPETVTEVGYIIRTDCSDPGGTSWGSATKDGTDSDRSVVLEGQYTVIYTKAGDANNYKSNDGGKTLELMKYIKIADMQTLTKIKVYFSDSSTKLTKDEIKLTDGSGNEVAVSTVSNNMITTSQPLDITKSYTLTADEMDPVTVVPLTYLSSTEFNNLYAYDGELGVELGENSTVFRLWAPTASEVKVNLFSAGNGGTAEETISLAKGEKGVWTYTSNKNLNGKYYTYTVTTCLGTNEAVDPYARSAGLNGLRGMILDLDETDPEGWDSAPF
ncbi:MAG: pullulanase-associated domain-containing protein, partial [Candidatus Coproplasma sp.]